MPTGFAGTTVLVTGSSRGIGGEIAKHLATLGARVAVTYSSQPEKAQALFSTLTGSGHLLLQLNVADEASVEAAFSKIHESFGGLDYLVNNAGITKDQLLLRMKAEDFDQVIATNLRGTFLCTRAAIKGMVKARKGSIVNITSVVGQTGNPGQSNYAASKAAVEAFSRSIAVEVASRGVRVNCVAPGFIVTEMTDVLTDAQKQGILDRIPLKTMGQSLDIANAVAFLLSPQASYITGQTLSVNGGMFLS